MGMGAVPLRISGPSSRTVWPAWSELDIRDGSRAANGTPVSRYHESLYRYFRYYRMGHMLLADLACWVFRLVQDAPGDGQALINSIAFDGAGLTQREREILISFAKGKYHSRIAEARGVKPVTVRNAIYGIQSKLKVRTMQELVLWAVRNGLLDDYATDG